MKLGNVDNLGDAVDFSARAGLDAFPYGMSLRSELRSSNICEKI